MLNAFEAIQIATKTLELIKHATNPAINDGDRGHEAAYELSSQTLEKLTEPIIDKEALELALEALNSIKVSYRSVNGNPLEVTFDEVKCETAIKAINSILAQIVSNKHKGEYSTLPKQLLQESLTWTTWWRSHGQYNYSESPLTPKRIKELMKLAFEVGCEVGRKEDAEPAAWLIKYEALVARKNKPGSLTKFDEQWVECSFVSENKNAEIFYDKWRNRREIPL